MPARRADAGAVRRTVQIERQDVDAFAAASGDRNPLHVDPAFGRRTAFGEPVVHGALATIALLGGLPQDALAGLTRVRASFAGPVLIGAPVASALEPDPRRPGGWRGTLSGRGRPLLRLEAWPDGDEPAGAPPAGELREDDMRTAPADLDVASVSAGDEAGGRYETGPALRDVALRWDAGGLDASLLEALAWASYVVGMQLPGLRSLLAGLDVAAFPGSAPGPGRHRVRVAHLDERTGGMRLEGVLAGPGGPRATASIEAFGRPRPTAPRAAGPRIGTSVEGRVVVVGGSRGFGASLVLSLLETGHAVDALYAVSHDASEELRSAAGPHADRLSLHRVDARDPAGVQQVAEALRATEAPLRGIVLNAAAPPLAMRLTGESAAGLAGYVADSLQRSAVPLGALLPLLGGAGAWMLFCSTAAMDDPPSGWPHYLAAKGALEGLARWAAATHPEARTLVLRAPKMRTDLTSSPSGALGAAAPDDVARWVVGRLGDGELRAGLTILDPPIA
jgi:NAD(P)-dependent dehydrogenase (short-subunit alcohol dehydrogenase family)/acyl dehydratase